ncbi:MAG: AAA family ATPase [Limisphaerales bacterium]
MSSGLDNCLAFIQSQAASEEINGNGTMRNAARAVTISRQAGCGALVVAEKLANLLQKAAPKNSIPWTVFDRNLMDKVLEEHELPKYLSKFMREDRVSKTEDFITDLLGSQPPQWKMVRETSETMLKLADLGNVILIGRGGNVITSPLPDVLHVRLVCPLEKRMEHAHEAYNMTKTAARAFCLKEDRGRARYLKKYFHADINNPTGYHLVINTGMVGYEEAARLIAEAATHLKVTAPG